MDFMSLKTRIHSYLTWKRHTLRTAKLRREHPLRYLFLEVTRTCNLACVYCGSECTGKTDERELSIDEWIEIIRQIAADFDPARVMIAVTGGEPLLKEGIFRLFNELKRLGFHYGIVTNGMILNEALANDLVIAGIGSISISMDALPDVNDRLRGKGTSKKVEEAVKNLHNAGYRSKLEIISTITRPALSGLDSMRRYVSSLRVPLWRAAPVMPIGRAARHPELIPKPSDVRYMLEYIRSARQTPYIPKPEFSEEGFLGLRFEGWVRPYLCLCSAGITVAGIRHNGMIGACPELTSAFDQGDIRKENFRAAWEERFHIFRDRSWTRKGPCAECEYYDICQGGALHLYPDTQSPFLRCFYLMLKDTEKSGYYNLPSGTQWFPEERPAQDEEADGPSATS